MVSVAVSTLLACAWPDGDLDGTPVQGLARGDYKLMPLWIWLYSLLCFIIQDGCKVATLLLMRRSAYFSVQSVGAAQSGAPAASSESPSKGVGNGDSGHGSAAGAAACDAAHGHS